MAQRSTRRSSRTSSKIIFPRRPNRRREPAVPLNQNLPIQNRFPMNAFPFNRPGALRLSLLIAVLSISPFARAAIIGTNTPAHPVTAARVAALAKPQRTEWLEYLKHSDELKQLDQEFLRRELHRHGLQQVSVPAEARGRRWLPLDRDPAWYAGPEGRRIADIVLSFQTPAGGWSKNIDLTTQPRSPGMHFAPDNSSRFLDRSDFDAPITTNWNYVGTFDNDATIMQVRFLSRVVAAAERKPGAPYRAAILRALDYILA